MIGAKGPAFALPDGDGKIHRVTPGATGRPLVVISHMGFYWARCVHELGELERHASAIRALAAVYVINPDTVENNRKVPQTSGLSIPILLDPEYRVARMYDLPAEGRPMRGLVGYVIMDSRGLIRVQRVDLDFGAHGPQIVETLRIITTTNR